MRGHCARTRRGRALARREWLRARARERARRERESSADSPSEALSQVAPPELLLRLVVPTAVASLRKFLEERGCHVDIAALRREHPALLTFEDWLRRRGLDKRVLPPAGWAACAIE